MTFTLFVGTYICTLNSWSCKTISITNVFVLWELHDVIKTKSQNLQIIFHINKLFYNSIHWNDKNLRKSSLVQIYYYISLINNFDLHVIQSGDGKPKHQQKIPIDKSFMKKSLKHEQAGTEIFPMNAYQDLKHLHTKTDMLIK